MKPQTAEHLIDTSLVITASVYAAWLWKTKKIGEPNWTWLKVAVGSAMCLTAAGLRSRVRQADWRDHEAATWRAFVLGGIPIVIEEVLQAELRRQHLLAYLRERPEF